MLKRGIIFILFLFPTIFGYFRLSAQTHNFRNYSVEHGLPFIQVYTIFQDSRGYLWSGGYGGLSRFDGRRFVNFSPRNGLITHWVTSIAEDNQGHLWVGTTKGITTLKIRELGEDVEKIQNFTTDNGLTDNYVNTVYSEKSGDVLIGTRRGVCLYRRGSFSTVGLFDKNIISFLRDKSGRLWIGTSEGIFREEGGNFRKSDYLNGHTINAIFQDINGVIWFGTNKGIFSLQGTQMRSHEDSGFPVGVAVSSITGDHKKDLWVGTSSGLFNFESGKAKKYTLQKDINSNSIGCLFFGSEKNLWIGTNSGFFRYRGDVFVSYTEEDGLSGSFVYGIFRDHKDALWICNDNGVNILQNGKFENVMTRFGLPRGVYYSGYSDKQENTEDIWIGGEKGIFRISGNSVRSYHRDDGVQSDTCLVIIKDSKGRVWFGGTRGVTSYQNGKFTSYKLPGGGENSMVATIHEDRKGNIWVGEYQGHVYKFDGRSFINMTVRLSLPSSSTMAITEDAAGNLFFGTFDGLFILTKDSIKNINETDGLNSDLLYVLTFEPNGKFLWIGTNQGLNRINVNSFINEGIIQLENYGKEEGFSGVECNSNGVYQDYDGSVWYGTVNGLIHYNPSEHEPNIVRSKTHITELRLFYNDTILPSGTELSYAQNHLSFEFTGICLTNPSRVKYRYMLEGFDKSWSPDGTENLATYSNLPPGNYNFKVISSNNEGLWNMNPASFAFVILRPFWKTWWFSVLVIVLAAGIITVVLRYRIAQIKFRESIKTKLASNELKALRSQMNPHFIFNSLNSIQHFIINKDEEAASKYLNTFARLIRIILNNTERSNTSVREELDALKLYLELEKLRFENKFDYSIKVDPDIDPDYYEMPTMLIQPYVENAILHGLIPRQGEGKLLVEVKKNENYIICRITDNGIGRKKAKELKEKSIKKTHKSFGMRITQDRLELLNNTHNSHLSVNITDLADEKGEPLGTQVEIFIPIA